MPDSHDNNNEGMDPPPPHLHPSPDMTPPLSPLGGRAHPFQHYNSGYRLHMLPPGSPNCRLRSRSMDHPLAFGGLGSGGGSPRAPPHFPSSHSVPVSPTFHSGHGRGEHNPPYLPANAVAGMPFLPFEISRQQEPPEPSDRQRVMESAVASERQRAKLCEEQETNMTADELRAVLKSERRRTAKIAADLAAFRMAAVDLQLQAEVIEEGRINSLLGRLDYLQQEKGRIILDLEREEEMLTNTLQKQLNEVRREKAVLQQQIDHEKKNKSKLETRLSDLKGTNNTNVSKINNDNSGMGKVVEEGDEQENDDEDENGGEKVELEDLFEKHGITGYEE